MSPLLQVYKRGPELTQILQCEDGGHLDDLQPADSLRGSAAAGGVGSHQDQRGRQEPGWCRQEEEWQAGLPDQDNSARTHPGLSNHLLEPRRVK